jgi:hypothetical protein
VRAARTTSSVTVNVGANNAPLGADRAQRARDGSYTVAADDLALRTSTGQSLANVRIDSHACAWQRHIEP